jgi:NAD(P)-dependent dehydrogenase (short-subunit alcohol dehydrogenase family)
VSAVAAAPATRVALVTGASAGIGEAIARQLLAQGYEVVSLSLGLPTFTHDRLHAYTVDLCARQATADVVADVVARHRPDTLVHNAGVILPARVEDVKLSELDALVELHLAAAIVLVQAALPAMKAAGFGRIVLMSSRGALGLATRTAYAATKAGMVGMARTWALELAAHGVTVNVVAPGPIQTEMFHRVVPADSPKVAQIAASIPVGRLGQPEDVARAVRFFVSADAGFVTGQVLYVCGGASLGSLTL